MKKLYWLILIALTSCQKPFTEVNEKYNEIEYLVTQIRPSTKVDKWEVFYNNFGEPRSVFDSNRNLEFKDSIQLRLEQIGFNGFFTGCLPAYCSYLIVTSKRDSIEIIDSVAKLENFIGRVDNLEEAIIISKINGFDLSIENKTGKYRNTKNGFEFIGQKFIRCPRMILEYNIQVNENSDVKSQFLDTVEFSKDCIIP